MVMAIESDVRVGYPMNKKHPIVCGLSYWGKVQEYKSFVSSREAKRITSRPYLACDMVAGDVKREVG
jgi:hypothetical protein